MSVRSSSSICSRCSHRSQWHRGISSSSRRQALGPESPKYIHVPQPLQAPRYEKTKRVRGALPVARDVFRKNSEYKATEWFKEKATPEPRQWTPFEGQHAERLEYEQDMSSIRRQAMREGITELWERRQKDREVRGKKSSLKRMENVAAAHAPAPLDEILTDPSLHSSVRFVLATKNAPIKSSPKSSKYPAKQAAASAARKAHLHDLYVNAQHFIVTEEQLDEEIEKVFGSDDYPVRFNKRLSVWGLGQKPMTANEMLADGRSEDKILDEGSMRRMKRIAEELTGGKMSDLGRKKPMV